MKPSCFPGINGIKSLLYNCFALFGIPTVSANDSVLIASCNSKVAPVLPFNFNLIASAPFLFKLGGKYCIVSTKALPS